VLYLPVVLEKVARWPPQRLHQSVGGNAQVQYDGAGNRTRLQWPSNTNGTGAYFVTYTYDALNRVTEIDANGSTATPLAVGRALAPDARDPEKQLRIESAGWTASGLTWMRRPARER
jgi:large exoprotein involved in heme utilization and adhesion